MRFISLAILILFVSVLCEAQISVPGSLFENIDIAHDTTTLSFHKSVQLNYETKQLELLDPNIRASVNNYYPRGLNDGPVWKGKGLTTEIHAGFAGKLKALTFAFYPVIFYSQNLEQNLTPNINVNALSPFGYQFGRGRIDWVQRYGASSFVSLHPGQSEIKLQFGKFVTSLSTQNYSVGPSVYNPIILSRQGAGFPHLRIGSNPFDVSIKNVSLGTAEINFIAGFLKESDYFDGNDDNNKSYFNGLFLAYSPSFLKNLTIGFNKTLYKQTKRFSAQDLLSVITVLDTVGPNDQFDQLASATLEWKFPEVGFRAYAEFAYNDFGGYFRWIEPEHSRAYTIGFEKESQLQNKDIFTISYEHTNLSRNHTYLWRAEPTFYIHSVNRQGYTNQGQLLGAGIGPGSNSDMLVVKYNHQNSTIGLSGQRIETNKDYLVVNNKNSLHDQEYSVGGYAKHQFKNANVFFEIIRSKNYYKYYTKTVGNLYLSIGASIRIQ